MRYGFPGTLKTWPHEIKRTAPWLNLAANLRTNRAIRQDDLDRVAGLHLLML